jgi:N,N'-diacetyllegionaminate synthase
MSKEFSIASRRIGGGAPCFMIVEVGQAHDGSLGLAHQFIDAATEIGADAVKFQTHIAAAESTLDEPFRVKFSRQDETRFAYWRRMEFTPEQWAGLAAHAAEKQLVFLSSAFSIQAVELLARIGMPAWKIASGELGSQAILAAMVATGAPFIASSGMSPWAEIDALVAGFRKAGRDVAMLQCTTRYPTPLDQVGLNVIGEMRARYTCPVGLSDHSGSPVAGLAAIARGADVIEAHLTLDRRMFGPDVPASLTVPEFAQLVQFRDALARIDANPVDKDAAAAELAPLRAMFRRSLAPVRALARGTILEPSMLAAKKPSTGIGEDELPAVLGRRLARDVVPERLLRWEDLETTGG